MDSALIRLCRHLKLPQWEHIFCGELSLHFEKWEKDGEVDEILTQLTWL